MFAKTYFPALVMCLYSFERLFCQEPIAGNVEAGTSYARFKAASNPWVGTEPAPEGYRSGKPSNMTYARGYGDFDGDGTQDIVICVGFLEKRQWRPEIYLGDGKGRYKKADSKVLADAGPGATWPRKLLVADFNGDGRDDFLVISTGWDAAPWPGDFPHLYLSGPDGKLRFQKGYESIVGFFHGGASGDLDGDGDIDVLLANGGARGPDGNPRQPCILINDGKGSFTVDRTGIPGSLVDLPFFSAELVDVDEDGRLDLLAGGDEKIYYEGKVYDGVATAVYWGTGDGTFSDGSRTVIPEILKWGAVLDFIAQDIDGHPGKELIVLRTTSYIDLFYKGYKIQILKRGPEGSFTETQVITDENAPWIDWLRLKDVNGDGTLDLIHDDKKSLLAWLGDGSGAFGKR